MVARRAGACIPYALRKRVASVLKCLDVQAAQGGRGSIYLAYGAAFVGFLLALRYYKECRRLRELNIAQKDAFDMHVLKVSTPKKHPLQCKSLHTPALQVFGLLRC